MQGRKYPPAEPITSRAIKHIAGVGLKTPSKLTTRQVQKLAASVESHIEPRRQGRRLTPRGGSTRRMGR
jgi:hypothetical protein